MNNEYKTVCDKCGLKTWYEVEMPCTNDKVPVYCNCCDQIKGYTSKCRGTLRVIDNSELNPRATQYYKSGERVEITYKDGEKLRCYIGKSTGWKPIYLEILRANSSGGSSLYLPDDATIRGIGKYK